MSLAVWRVSREGATGWVTMIERLGNVLYWACCILSGLAAVASVAILFGTEKVLAVMFGLIALTVYGIGRAVRYVLVGS